MGISIISHLAENTRKILPILTPEQNTELRKFHKVLRFKYQGLEYLNSLSLGTFSEHYIQHTDADEFFIIHCDESDTEFTRIGFFVSNSEYVSGYHDYVQKFSTFLLESAQDPNELNLQLIQDPHNSSRFYYSFHEHITFEVYIKAKAPEEMGEYLSHK